MAARTGTGAGEGGGEAAGRRVLVTRSREGASRLADELRALGLVPVELPVLAVEAITAEGVGARAARSTDLVVTSATAVRRLVEALREEGGAEVRWAAQRMWPVGPATLRAAVVAGLLEGDENRVALPETWVAEGLAAAWEGQDLRGRSFFFPRAESVRPVVEEALHRAGAEVDACVLYRTVPPPDALSTLRALVAAGEVPALVTLASSRTARHWAALVDGLTEEERPRWRSLPVVSIGPITSQTIEELGLSLAAEAQEASVPALARAAREVLDGQDPPS